jgi:hypothetical protein
VLSEATGPACQYILSSAIQHMPANTFQSTVAPPETVNLPDERLSRASCPAGVTPDIASVRTFGSRSRLIAHGETHA